jgi:hypothetical protein
MHFVKAIPNSRLAFAIFWLAPFDAIRNSQAGLNLQYAGVYLFVGYSQQQAWTCNRLERTFRWLVVTF